MPSQNDIMEVLRVAPAPMTTKEIADALGSNTNNTGTRLNQLKHWGLVQLVAKRNGKFYWAPYEEGRECEQLHQKTIDGQAVKATFVLSKELLDDIDELARSREMTRSEAVRWIVTLGLESANHFLRRR